MSLSEFIENIESTNGYFNYIKVSNLNDLIDDSIKNLGKYVGLMAENIVEMLFGKDRREFD